MAAVSMVAGNEWGRLMRKICGLATALVAVMASVAPAQIVVPATPPRPAPAGTVISADSIELKAGTRLMIQTSDPLLSKSSRAGDHFAIALADPIAADGHELIHAGIVGQGEVIHAAKARWGGKAGEFSANARFLDCGSVRLPIGHLHWASSGASKVGDALALSLLFSPAMFFVNGGEVEIPAGTTGEVQLTSDVVILRAAAGQCLGTPTAPTATTAPVAPVAPTP